MTVRAEDEAVAAERREALRQSSYAAIAAACPVPIRREPVPLPAGLSLFDDEFVVASSPDEEVTSDRVVLTTQRLLHSQCRGARRHVALHLRDVRELAFEEPRFSDHGALTLVTASGRAKTIRAMDDLVAPQQLLALIRYARDERGSGADGVCLGSATSAVAGATEAGVTS